MGGYSDNNQFWPLRNGLVFAIDFINLDGNVNSGDFTIPEFAPDIDQIDFAFFKVSQYKNGVLQFQAEGLVVNNISTIPIPPAVWLFGSGLIGLI